MKNALRQLGLRLRRRHIFHWAYLVQVAVLHLGFLVLVPSALADDCATDPTRAEDCLRTPGFAENLGTGVAVLGVILVNGVAIQTIILKQRDPDDESKDPPVTFNLNVRTQESRNTIKPDGKDSLWVYANVTCSDPKVDCSGMTAAISFTPGGANGNWIQFAQQDFQEGCKAVQLLAANPTPTVPVPAPSADLTISAPVPDGMLRATLPLQLPVQLAEWEVLIKPDGVTEIMPDTKQSLTIYARIKFDETAFPDAATLKQVQDETKASIKMNSSTDWVKLDEPLQDTGDHMASWVIASNPSGNVGGTQGPEACIITINGSFQGTPLATNTVTIKLTARPEIDAKPDSVQLLAGSGGSDDVTVWLTNPGPGAWNFEPKVIEGPTGLVSFSKTDINPTAIKLTITECAGALQSGASNVYCTISVFATCDVLPDPLQRYIKVAVCQEGLVIVGGSAEDGVIHVRADGKQQKTRMRMCAYVYNAEKKALEADLKAAQSIQIEIDEEPKSMGDNVAKACVVHYDPDGAPSAGDADARFLWWAEKEIPGEDRMLVRYKASVPGLNPDKFSKQLPVTIEAMTLEEESAAKEIEIERCRQVISKYIPTGKQQQFYALLDKRQGTLGPKGLAALRRKIWSIAVNLILAEGAEGYKDEAEWADRIVVVLEWAQWAGDIAFNAAAAALCGPVGQVAAPFIKDALVDAINCYQNGEDFETWATARLWGVWGAVEGQALDIDRLTKLTGGSKYKAWAIFIGYTFGKKLYNGVDVVTAAKETAQEIGMQQFNGWLGEKAKASYQKHGLGGHMPPPEGGPGHPDEGTSAHPDEGEGSTKPHGDEPGTKPAQGDEHSSGAKKADEPTSKPDESHTKKPGDEPGAKKPDGDEPGTKKPDGDEPGKKPDGDEPGKGDDDGACSDDDKPSRDDAWKEGREKGKEAINDFENAMEGDNPETKRQAALRFLRDKNAMMELNHTEGANGTRKQLKEELNNLYKDTDAGTKIDLANEYGVPDDEIRTFNASNPKKPSDKVTVSYDRDVTYQRRCKEGEIIRDPQSGEFRKATRDDWVDIPASVTDKHYSRNFYEASTGKQGASDSEVQNYAHTHDQTCTDRLSADAYGNRQKDLETALKHPGREFSDPEQIGQCMAHKGNEWYEKAHQVESTHPDEAEGYRAEGMRQTSKQYDNQVKARVEALRAQGVEVKTNPKLESAMGEMKKVERGEQSPVQAEANIRKLGFESPEQVGYESGKYLESLQKLRPKIPKG